MRRPVNFVSEDNSNRPSTSVPRGCYDQLTGIEHHNEKRRMSKVRINDLARELEVKSRG